MTRIGSRRAGCAGAITRRATAGAAAWLAVAWAIAGPAGAQQPAPVPASVIDGPTSALVTPIDLGASIARDGTGGAVYLKQAGGGAHVFISMLTGGVFQPPEEVDAGLAGPSSQPVIAAGSGGLLVVAFINAGQLFVTEQPAGGNGFSAPTSLAGGASNPAISMTNVGKAYVAFAVADGSGTDVRTAYYFQGQWGLENAPLNVSPGDNAGSGTGRPAVAAAGDGVAVVAWGEAGGIHTRRVWGLNPSVVSEQADGPLPGCTEVSADQPVVGAGGDSTYADVAFHERLTCGEQPSSRVLMNRLNASDYDGLTQPDGLAGGGDNAGDPQIAVGEYGDGLVTSERTASHALVATSLGDNGISGDTGQVNAIDGASAPTGVPAMAGLNSRLVAWEQDPGAAGFPEIRLRYAPGKGALGPETVLSSPGRGATDAAAGLAAAGDVGGDAAVLWVQGSPGSLQIMAAQLYEPPGGLSISDHGKYVRTARPMLSWTSPPHEAWGPVQYGLSVDGVSAVQTGATAAQPPTPLSDGPHTYQITATNPAGQQGQSGVDHVFVDTTPPVARLTLGGTRQTGKSILARLRFADSPQPGGTPADASGVASVRLQWGEGTVVKVGARQRRVTHIYRRPGRYTVMLVVTDRAGNVTRFTVKLKVVKPPKPKPKPRPKGHLR